MRKAAAILMVGLYLAATARAGEAPGNKTRATSSNEWTLVAGGDVMMGRYMAELLRRDGPKKAFRGIRPILRQADIAFCNLESPMGSAEDAVMFPDKPYNFRASSESARALRQAGFTVASLANNHAMDHGGEALVKTRRWLWEQHIYPFGAGLDREQARLPAWRKAKGTTVAFLGYGLAHSTMVFAGADRPGTAPIVLGNIRSDIAKARKRANVVVVSLHWGTEYEHVPSRDQRALAHDIIDAGADLILGHHPHVLQGVEVYRGKPIAYSLGNLFFDQQKNKQDESLLLRFTFRGREMTAWEAIPLHRQDTYYPARAEGEKAEAILADFAAYSDALKPEALADAKTAARNP